MADVVEEVSLGMADQHRMRTMETVLAVSALFDKGKSLRDHFRSLDMRLAKAKAPAVAASKAKVAYSADERRRSQEHTLQELQKLNVLFMGAK